MKDLVPTTPVVPDFTPVPRKYRYDGWTPATHDAAKVGTGFASGVMGTNRKARGASR